MFSALRRVMCQAIAVAALLLLTAGGAVAAEAQSPVERHGQLRVEGTHIVGEHGEPVMLRGMSLFWSHWGGKYYNADVIAALSEDWRCNIVRAALSAHEDGYMGPNRQQELAKIETIIEAAIDRGIYVLVDWHAHEPHPQEAGDFFAHIAQKYGEHPNVIYEIWNEPLKQHDWGRVIKPYHEAVIPRIREFDPDSLIICGTQTWSQDVDKAAADPLDFDNVAYAVHFYAGTHKQSLRDKIDKALSLGAAVMVTEWGVSKSNGDGGVFIPETRAWLGYMYQHKLSWCNWSLHDKRETSAALRPGAPEDARWTARDLSKSGLFLRQVLRQYHDAEVRAAQ